MADDRLLTSSSSRAEVQLDSANMIRIGPNSEVRFAGMDVRSFQIQVAAGTVTFRALRAQPGASGSGHSQRGRSSAAAGRVSRDGA